MSASSMAHCNSALVVAAAGSAETFSELFEGAALPKIFSAGDDTTAKAWCGWFVGFHAAVAGGAGSAAEEGLEESGASCVVWC